MPRTPEYRASWAAEIETTRAQRPGMLTMVGTAFYVLYVIAVSLTPIVILLGVVPDLDAALHYALVVLVLLGATGRPGPLVTPHVGQDVGQTQE